jgi:cobyrinic acid a,c-diamide synthase
VINCPALLVSAPASGQGKTTVTAALARYHKNQGRKVRVFKTGPDFIDPMILEQASGHAVYQLDLWMGGEAHCRQMLYQAASEADLILIEGVMGLFDGDPSSADLAMLFDIPVLAVIDATSMAQTFGALAHGLASYRKELPFSGIIANRIASQTHGDMVVESLPSGMRYFGGIPRSQQVELPSRHLGLFQADEIHDLDSRLSYAAQVLIDNKINVLPDPVAFFPTDITVDFKIDILKGQRIAVARDAAFSFIYRANLELLESMGAELCFFSPLSDTSLPETDAVYFPGGYPELHLQALEKNTAMHESIRLHQNQGKPIVAECGGMLYLLQSLTDKAGESAQMAGLLPGHATMQKRLANLGLHRAPLPEGEIRGHTFHHSKMHSPAEPILKTISTRKNGRGEAVYRDKRLHASYMHLYFPSNPNATAKLFSL